MKPDRWLLAYRTPEGGLVVLRRLLRRAVDEITTTQQALGSVGFVARRERWGY